MQVSKSRKQPLLLDPKEMVSLFDALGDFYIFNVSQPVVEEEAEISKELFLEVYHQYVDWICGKKQQVHPMQRVCFSSIFTVTKDLLYAIALQNGKLLVKASKPVVQLQPHSFIFSHGKFHSGVSGVESVSWGVLFSYPQLYLDPKTNQIGKVDRSEAFANSTFFHTLTKWVRNQTVPTPFLVEGKKVNQPIRLGKQAFEWIDQHESLRKRALHVESRNHP